MNENQIKTKIFLLKGLDTVLVLSLLGAGVYAALYAPNKEFMIVACFIGLFLVNIFGRFSAKKVSVMRIQLEMIRREKKAEEQRTLLSTRHTIARTTKHPTASTKTTPTKK